MRNCDSALPSPPLTCFSCTRPCLSFCTRIRRQATSRLVSAPSNEASKKANRAVLVLPAHTSAHRHKHLYTCIRVHARTLLTAVIITVNIVASLVHGRDSSTGLDLVERALGEGAFDDNMRCVPCARVNFSTQPAHSLLCSFTPSLLHSFTRSLLYSFTHSMSSQCLKQQPFAGADIRTRAHWTCTGCLLGQPGFWLSTLLKRWRSHESALVEFCFCALLIDGAAALP